MEEATSSSVLLVQNSVQIPDLMIALYGSRYTDDYEWGINK